MQDLLYGMHLSQSYANVCVSRRTSFQITFLGVIFATRGIIRLISASQSCYSLNTNRQTLHDVSNSKHFTSMVMRK